MPLQHAIILIICFLACCAVYAQSVCDPYSYNAIAGFANQLVEQREYYRAYQEYHRLNSYYPSMYPDDAFIIASLYCHYQGGQFQWILDYMSHNSIAKPQIWIFTFDSAFNNLLLSTQIIDTKWPQGIDKEFEAMIMKRKLAYSLLAMDNYNELSPYMLLAKDFDLQRIYEYSKFTRDKLKNPYVAMVWGIIPGGGYIYSDNTADGIIASIVIGVCAVVTYFAVDTGNSGIAVFTGAAGAFFYGGSILGGFLAAKRSNTQIMKELTSYLEEELKFAQDREMIFNKYGKPKSQ